jgi:16S rRNA (cytosine967-C5)-methyltransferase
MTARAAIVQVLADVERGAATLADALEREREEVQDRRDRGLLLEVAAGTTRWLRELDTVLQAASRRPLEDLDPLVRAVLRAGAYQLRHLDRVPAHAVVHDSVETTRRVCRPRAAPFVNAVLRSLARAGSRAPLPGRPEAAASRSDWLAYLSVTLSHPEWLVARWLDRHGPAAAEAWCRFNNAPPSVTLRVTSDRSTADVLSALDEAGVEASTGRFVTDAIDVPAGGTGRIPAAIWREAVIHDEGSQLVGCLAAAESGDVVLDACAAPGGKTAILARSGARLVVACDLRPSRVALLQTTLARAGIGAPIVRLDAAAPLPFPAVFDTVLLDAPCSGLGTVRRDPDVKWARRESDLERLADTQLRMLAHAASVVRPGGSLVYATCSSEPEENEDVVARFLSRHSGFVPVDAHFTPNVSGGERLLENGRLSTLPFRDRLDAYFAAVLRRRPSPGTP